MDFQATLDAHGITWEQLVDAAILMGTDFNAGIDGIGPKTAVKLVTEHGDLWGALEARDAHVDHAERIRDMFLTPAVTDDYDLDLTMDPDVEAAREFVTGEWEVAADEVERGFERIEDSLVQTGLDEWT